MINRARKVFIGCTLLVIWVSTQALSQPPTVPRLTERYLDKASYVQLAKEWKQYIKEHGETADALVNLGIAYDYSGQQEAALYAARRAVAADPDNPQALEFLGKMLAVYKSDDKSALEYLKRCREIAPDYKRGLTMLTAIYLRTGEWDKADDVLRTLFEQRVIHPPLQDYAYNMLVGLPEGAVLITNGDNDTFPPLALQAGMDFRRDVIIINRSLLNLKTYAESLFKKHPQIKPKGSIEAGKNEILSTTLLKRLVDEQKAPLYFAATVSPGGYFFIPEKMAIEGLNMRVAKKGLSSEESARMILEKYRMDSVTDWNFAWALVPAISHLMTNYVSCMIKLSQEEEVSGQTRMRLLDKALEIAQFHDMGKMESLIVTTKNRGK